MRFCRYFTLLSKLPTVQEDLHKSRPFVYGEDGALKCSPSYGLSCQIAHFKSKADFFFFFYILSMFTFCSLCMFNTSSFFCKFFFFWKCVTRLSQKSSDVGPAWWRHEFILTHWSVPSANWCKHKTIDCWFLSAAPESRIEYNIIRGLTDL